MKKLKEKNQEKGITLIALVITIIVLLILAGVTIATLTGDNGILTKASEAREKTENAVAEEAVKMEVLGSFDNTGNYNKNLAKTNLEKNLGAIVEENNQNGTLKVTYKGENFLVDKNGNTFRIEIPEDLEIGDIVSYTPKAQEYSWKSKYSGDLTDLILNNTTEDYEITKWKVLNINDNGTIDLIAEKPTKGAVPLAYAQGYNNGVKLLNDACNELYGDNNKGIVSRSINIEDIESKMTEETLESIKKDSGTNSPALYEEQMTIPYSSENSMYPIIYEQEKSSVINGKKNEDGIGKNEQENFIERTSNGSTNGGIIDAESIQPYQTYYYRNQNDVQTFFAGSGVGTSNLFYNLLMPEGTKTSYWIASRVIHVEENWCNFGIRCIFWGMNMPILSTSHNLEEQKQSYCIFPIVTINFNILEGNHMDGWIIK